MKPAVRYCHGILGCVVSLFGPFVVWTGWIRCAATFFATCFATCFPTCFVAPCDAPRRLAPVVSRALDQTPLVWMSLAITGVVAVAINRYIFIYTSCAVGAKCTCSDSSQILEVQVDAAHCIFKHHFSAANQRFHRGWSDHCTLHPLLSFNQLNTVFIVTSLLRLLPHTYMC
jgi:hypothetical protein